MREIATTMTADAILQQLVVATEGTSVDKLARSLDRGPDDINHVLRLWYVALVRAGIQPERGQHHEATRLARVRIQEGIEDGIEQLKTGEQTFEKEYGTKFNTQ